MTVMKKRLAPLGRKMLGLLQVAAAYVIVYWIFKGKAGLKIDRRGIKGLQPPFIVVGNHTSYFDPALAQMAIAPHPCYFLTTNFYFRHPVIGKVLNIFGAIPKIQFMPDIRSTRGALAAIARHDVVGIFPEGRRSIDGSCCAIPDSIARFIKKAQVPVVAVTTSGGYFVWPRWSSFRRPGRMETVAKPLLSATEIAKMDAGQILSVIRQALAYNDYDWNRRAKVDYSHPKAAERLDLILHQCPRCLDERSMRATGTELSCCGCGNTAVVDQYGLLQPLDDTCVVFDDPVEWTAWQRENMSAMLHDKDFCLQAVVKDLRVADKYYGAYRSCGRGLMVLRREGLYFHGEVAGQMTDKFFPIEMVPTVSTEFGHDFEICDNQHAWWLFLEEEQQTVRIECAISLLHKRRTG